MPLYTFLRYLLGQQLASKDEEQLKTWLDWESGILQVTIKHC